MLIDGGGSSTVGGAIPGQVVLTVEKAREA